MDGVSDELRAAKETIHNEKFDHVSRIVHTLRGTNEAFRTTARGADQTRIAFRPRVKDDKCVTTSVR